jgi:DNA polymerase
MTEFDGQRRCEVAAPHIRTGVEIRQIYVELVARRKTCRHCLGLTNPSDCEGGKFDTDQIGPWTLWQGNLNAKLLVVGQDWGDARYFVDNAGRDTPSNRTNRTLRHLLSVAGVQIDSPSPHDSGAGSVFFTNAILCLKRGGMQAKVDPAWFASCGKLFLKPTIELIAPTVVVTLGVHAYRTICSLYQLRPQSFRRAVDGEATRLPSGPLLKPVYHCGARVLNKHRALDVQERDWSGVRRALADTGSESRGNVAGSNADIAGVIGTHRSLAAPVWTALRSTIDSIETK